MRYLVFGLLLFFLAAVPADEIRAGVAEASTVSRHNDMVHYDFSGLSDDELQWFITFLNGNTFADGWEEITEEIVSQLPPDAKETSRRLLKDLGNKIGREWCRENDVRRIDTGMLKKWGRKLKSTADKNPRQIAELIKHIRGEVDSILD